VRWRLSGHRKTKGDRHVQRAADPAVFRRLPELGALLVIQDAADDQLRLDAGDATLRFRGGEPGFEPAKRPLLAFGEPPNVRELSGADGAEQHLRR
jgi:hypothetical protein